MCSECVSVIGSECVSFIGDVIDFWLLIMGCLLMAFVLDCCFFPYWFLGAENQLQILILKVP